MDLGAATNLLGLLGDPTRVRLVSILAHLTDGDAATGAAQELSVAELVEITGVTQSRVSTHLGRLREAGVVRDRREGSSAFYSLNDAGMSEPTRKVLSLVRGELKDATLEADARRADSVVKRRKSGVTWLESVAGHMERHYSPGRTWESMAHGVLTMLQAGDVLDAGCGDGTVASLVAPRAASVTCLDRSPRMIEAASSRLASLANVRTVLGDVHTMPFDDASFDAVLFFHVLTCAEDPKRALAEAARVLRPCGTLSVLVLDAHDHAELTASYGHVHAGFRPRRLESMIAAAGLEVDACDVTSRERREPFFQVVTASARKPAPATSSPVSRPSRAARRSPR
ncbi:ArsR/SmtB family transcription factor [Sandaracinus amylolyticus]|uniref:SAM-dependent methyltransferase n=1 Tax=Sandaracinus amylolyticus TaxID=927083 RepID=A0A0F6W562_9BACT|nr:metalloregulator ArsR/SmtB family transcription factor [Sandaracinus amylolyticus]AKF07698.1 SAM-dependent methyltransferase [Sandaracinus amylolyticus]